MWFVSYICQLFLNFHPVKKMNSQSWPESWLVIHIQRVTQGYQRLPRFPPDLSWVLLSLTSPLHLSLLPVWSLSHINLSQMCISMERSQWATGNGNLPMLLPLPKIQWFLFPSPQVQSNPLHTSRERKGNPLQRACLENPMDRGAWRVMVHRVATSQKQLKRLSTYKLCGINLFSSKIFIKGLLYVRHCLTNWGSHGNVNKQESLSSWSLHSGEGRRDLSIKYIDKLYWLLEAFKWFRIEVKELGRSIT